MKTDSIKINFIWNLTRMFLGTFSLLLTMPYITRVLGSMNLGKVEYGMSIVQYFILFSALGIPNYGTREVARVREDKEQLSRTVIELMIILLLTTAVSYTIFFFMLRNVTSLKDEKTLFLILGSNIIFTNMGVQWFYQGIENQKYITVRYIIAKIVTIGALFLLVKNQKNYIIYGGIMVAMESGSNIFNLINLRKYIEVKKEYFRELDIKRHIKPVRTIFLASVAISIYVKLDSVMVGALAGAEYVGYYSVSNRLIRLVIMVVTALGAVMMPRLSNCLKNSDREGYINYANYSLKYILFVSVPATLGTVLLSHEIILLMGGEEFLPSVLTMQILSPIILIVGLAYFLGYQVLYPQGLEKIYTGAVSAAALINSLFNYISIPRYYQNGAALGTVLAEITGLGIMLFWGNPQLKELEFYHRKNLKYLYASIIMGGIIFFIKGLLLNSLTTLILSLILGIATYLVSLIFLKEELISRGMLTIKKYLF